MSFVIRLKVPIEMHYTVIPMGTCKVNSSRVFHSRIALDEGLTLCVSIALSLHVSCFISSTNENLITVCCSGYGNMAISDLIYHQDLTVSSSLLK